MSVDGVFFSPSGLSSPDLNEKPTQEVIEIGRSLSLSEFCANFGSSLPQELRVDKGLKSQNEYIEDMKEGDIFVAHEVRYMEMLRAKLSGSGKKVTIPKNPPTSFALLPQVTDDVRSLEVRWEGAYTIQEMLKLPSLPELTAAVLNDCKDNNKRNVQKGTILYNLSTYKVLRKKGIRGETSDGVGHKFPEGVDTLFSIRYHDIRCNLAEIDEVCKSSLRARVISEGESELKCNNVVVFEKKMERVIMIQKVNSKGDLSSSPFPFPIDSGDLKVTPVKGSKQRTSNYYAENPVRVNSSTRFEEPGYDRLRVDVNQEPMVPIDSEGYAKTIPSSFDEQNGNNKQLCSTPSPLKDSKPEQTTPMWTQAGGYVNTNPGFESPGKGTPSPLKHSKPEQTTPMWTQAGGYVNTNLGFESPRKGTPSPLKDSKPEQILIQTQAGGYVNTNFGFESPQKGTSSPLKDFKSERTTPMWTQAVGYVNTNPGCESPRKVSTLPRDFKPGSGKPISPLKRDPCSLSTLEEQTTLTGAGYVNTSSVPKTSHRNQSLPRKLSLDSFMSTPPLNWGSGSILKEDVGHTSAMIIPSQDELMTSQIFRKASSYKDITAVNVHEHITQTCFVLGDVHTLQITHQGGTFPLHPFGPCEGEQQVECCATLEAPPGVVGRGVTVSVHYAVILDGPFKFPEKWERTSVVLYIDCPEKKMLIKSFKVKLHHWAVSSDSQLCFMKSNHLLQQGQTTFTFEHHANVISSQPNVASVHLEKHFCFVCIVAAKSSAPSSYFGMLLSEPLHNGIQKFWLCITYGVPSWISAVKKYFLRSEGSVQYPGMIENQELKSSRNKLTMDLRNYSGPGWSLEVTKHEVFLTELKRLSEPQYSDCEEKKLAFENGCYPPSVMLTVYYTSPPSLETHDQVPNVVYLSSEDNNCISFSFSVYNNRNVEHLDAPVNANPLSNIPVKVGWNDNLGEPSKPLVVHNLMPYINDLADEVVSISGWLDMKSELEVIKRTTGIINPREQLQELLKEWLEATERHSVPHTWDFFVKVVRGVRKGRVAERIVKDVFEDNGLPLDPDVLEKDVVSKMADNWYQFGKHLGLSLETLQSLGDSNYISDNSTRCLVVFRHWVKGAGPIESKTVRDKIEQAMRKVVKVTKDKMLGKIPKNEEFRTVNPEVPHVHTLQT